MNPRATVVRISNCAIMKITNNFCVDANASHGSKNIDFIDRVPVSEGNTTTARMQSDIDLTHTEPQV